MMDQSKVITTEDGIEADGLQSSLDDEIGMASYAFAQNDVEESKGRDDPQRSDLSYAGSAGKTCRLPIPYGLMHWYVVSNQSRGTQF